MGWIIAIPIIALIIVIYLFTKQEQRNKEEGIVFNTGEAMYCGGFNDIEGGKKTTITIYNNRIALSILKSSNNYFDGYSKVLYLDNIKHIGIKSETQIRSDITLGKMLLFGVFSLSMRSDKTITTNYLVIDYDNSENVTSIILNTDSNEKIIELVNELKRG